MNRQSTCAVFFHSEPFQLVWDVSERSQSDLHWDRYLRDLSERPQKRYLFCDVFKTSQIHLKKEIFPLTSLRRLTNISRKYFWFFKYVTNLILCDFRRVIAISDKVDVGPSETLKKWNVFWEQCININQSSLPSELKFTWEFWQVKDCLNPIESVWFTTFSDFFRLIKLYI